jgi:DNA-binding NarL/FixJ family response regulator
VRNHLSTIIQKLGVHNRTEAARLAERKGWL